MHAMFAKVAGEDMEIDALELKQILDFALKKGKLAIVAFRTSF